MAQIDDLLNDPDFLALSEEEQNAMVDELRQKDFKKVPHFEKVFDSLRKSQFGPFPFIPKSGAEAKDIPIAALRGVNSFAFGAPEFLSGEQLPRPETEFGKQLTTAAELAPLGLGGLGVAKGIGALGKRFGTPRRIQDVQKAFFPWVRKHTGEFGRALRESRKAAGQKSQLGVSKKQLEAIFSPVRGSKDARAQLPPKALKEIERIFKKEGASVDDLAKVSARLRRNLTSGERTGRQLTERRRTIMEVEKNIKGHLDEVLPGMQKAKSEYMPFSKVREVMTEKFVPGELKYGKLGSDKAYETFEGMKGFKSPTINAFKQFEDEAGVKFVEAAKRAATRRAVGKGVAKYSVPVGLGTLGLFGLYDVGRRIASKFSE